MNKTNMLPLIFIASINILCFVAESRRHTSNYRFLKHIKAQELNINFMQLFYIGSYISPFLCLFEAYVFSHEPSRLVKLFAVSGLFLSVNLRFWSINSLGRYWTKRCIFPDGLDRVTSGPYKYLRHPEYLSRILETFFWGLFFFAPSVSSVLVIYFIYLYLKITKDEHEQLVCLSEKGVASN